MFPSTGVTARAILAAFKVPRVSGQPLNLPSAPEPVTITELRELPLSVLESVATTPDQIMPLTGGADGLAQLSPYDFIGEDIDPLDSDDVRARKARGLRTLEDVREDRDGRRAGYPHSAESRASFQSAAALCPRSVSAGERAAGGPARRRRWATCRRSFRKAPSIRCSPR